MLEESLEVKTSIFIKPDSVVLQRNGAIKSRMVIEKGVRNTCLYSTPHGNMVLGIYGDRVDYDLTEKGGSLKMSYNIDSNLKLVSRNEVSIKIREI